MSTLSGLPGGQEGVAHKALQFLARIATPRATYALIALLVLGFGALAVRYHASASGELANSAIARRVALAQLAAATLSERLQRTADLGRSLAGRVRFAELVASGRWDSALEILRDVPQAFPYIERLFLSDVHGTLMVDVPRLAGGRGRNFAARDWYRGVSRRWQTHISEVYRRAAEPRRNVIAVATPVRDRASEVAGILVLQVSLEPFFDWARQIELDPGASLMVVDEKGHAAYATGVAAQSPVASLSRHPAVLRLARGESGALLAAADARGEDTLYAFVPAEHGWGVFIEQPASAAFAARDQQLRWLQLAYGLVALFAGTVVWLGMRMAAQRAAELKRVRRALGRHTERLRILSEIDAAIVEQRPPEAIASGVIQPLRALLDVPRAIVNRFDLAAGEAEWIAGAGRRRTHVGPGVRYPIAFMGDLEGLRRGEAQRVDVHALPRNAHSQALLDAGVQAYVAVPMIAGGELIGALSFGGAPQDLSAEQIPVAREAATQLAIAIAQARLHERVSQQARDLERRVAERTADLDAANRALEDLYNNAPCGYHSIDGRGLFVRMNDTELAWLGYAREEVIGRMGPRDLHTPGSLKLYEERFERFKQTGVARDVEYEYRRRDGSVLPVVLNATAMRDAQGNFVMSRSTVFDNTERKRARDEIQRLNAVLQARAAELESANRELEGFSYTVSHDLRAPLRAVDGFARMLEEDYGPRLDAEGRRLLGVVRASSRQMGELIDDLLAFSRLGRQPLARRPVDMQALAGEVVAGLAPGARASIELAALPGAEADPALLRQVWINLLDNALKYTGKREAPRVEVGGREQPGEALYWVRDNGAGFDMRYVGKLFRVFQRLHGAEEFPGTGVGLAIVQRVIARHGGRVWAEGALGEGACFYFSLPKEA